MVFRLSETREHSVEELNWALVWGGGGAPSHNVAYGCLKNRWVLFVAVL